MYNWVGFPFLRITFFFILGIIVSVYSPIVIRIELLLIASGILFLLSVLLLIVLKKYRFAKFNLLISLSQFFCVFTVATVITFLNTPSNSKKHILKVEQAIDGYVGIIKKDPVAKTKSDQLMVSVQRIKTANGSEKATGNVLLYVKRDSANNEYAYGQEILVSGTPMVITPPKNEEEFNYKEYIGYQGIYHNHFISGQELRILSEDGGNWVVRNSLKARKYFEQVLEEHVDTERERAIALALILGVKDELTDDISAAYSAAGAMHVLAVSGLHVGVIYGILLFVMAPLMKKRYGKWIFFLVTITALWAYAFVTGLSPSVLRAVTMFSFVTLAKVGGRQSNIYNTLAISALVLLCFNPYLIMAVGFQLSFLAVFGIVYLQPRIYSWLYISNKFLDKIWVITSVSIAAQIATAPLVVLYFHQLPTYFFISNLFVIPGAFLILCTGLLLFAVSWVPLVGSVIGLTLKYILLSVNKLVFLIQLIPFNIMDNLYLTTFQSWCIILFLLAMLAWFYFKRMSWLYLAVASMIIFSVQRLTRIIENFNNKEIVFYSANSEFAIDFIQGNQSELLIDSNLVNNRDKLKFHIAPYRLKQGIPLDYNSISSPKRLVNQMSNGVQLISWEGKTVAIVGEEFSDDLQDILKVDYVYLSKLNKKLYDRTIHNFEYDKLILRSYLELPTYIVNDKVHDLTTGGMLRVKV